ncbi:MAG: AAA family ATPase [Candidatus Moranbacteria bacterium]|nr:AAA family ATPase [Candidatus Moranbacteria bacterium]
MQGDKKVIAIVGMAGSGKTEVIKKAQEKYSVPRVYFGEVTFDEIKRRGLKVNYENERMVRESLRAKHGMGVYAELSVPKIKKFLEENKVVLIESLYSWDEYKIIKEEFGDNFITVAVYTSPGVRFERLKKRINERPIADRKEFKARDWTEIEGTQKGGPIAIADHTIINESTKEAFQEKIVKLFEKLI